MPGLGIAGTLQQAASLGFGSFDQIQIGAATVPILAALSGALVFGLVRSVQLRTPFQGIAIVAAILLLSLG